MLASLPCPDFRFHTQPPELLDTLRHDFIHYTLSRRALRACTYTRADLPRVILSLRRYLIEYFTDTL